MWDAEAGMYYNAARWYDPRLGRFVSRSPLAPEGEEEYVFCGNDPVNWVDVNGLEAEKIDLTRYKEILDPLDEQKELDPGTGKFLIDFLMYI